MSERSKWHLKDFGSGQFLVDSDDLRIVLSHPTVMRQITAEHNLWPELVEAAEKAQKCLRGSINRDDSQAFHGLDDLLSKARKIEQGEEKAEESAEIYILALSRDGWRKRAKDLSNKLASAEAKLKEIAEKATL